MKNMHSSDEIAMVVKLFHFPPFGSLLLLLHGTLTCDYEIFSWWMCQCWRAPWPCLYCSHPASALETSWLLSWILLIPTQRPPNLPLLCSCLSSSTGKFSIRSIMGMQHQNLISIRDAVYKVYQEVLLEWPLPPFLEDPLSIQGLNRGAQCCLR